MNRFPPIYTTPWVNHLRIAHDLAAVAVSAHRMSAKRRQIMALSLAQVAHTHTPED